MSDGFAGRREFLKGVVGAAGLGGDARNGDGDEPGRSCSSTAMKFFLHKRMRRLLQKNHIKFGVCGISHDHIYGMIGAVSAWRGRDGELLCGGAGSEGGVSEAVPEREDGWL